MPEGFIMFDKVFVPHERVFLDGETSHSATLAHALGLWERSNAVAYSGTAPIASSDSPRCSPRWTVPRTVPTSATCCRRWRSSPRCAGRAGRRR